MLRVGRMVLAARPAVMLAIETSFDDTAVAIVRGDRTILANIVHGQEAVHAPFQGVQPKLAAQTHATTLPLVLRKY